MDLVDLADDLGDFDSAKDLDLDVDLKEFESAETLGDFDSDEDFNLLALLYRFSGS